MTHVVTDNCIKCKYKDCVEVCPVDCFYAGENMLVISGQRYSAELTLARSQSQVFGALAEHRQEGRSSA